MSVETSLFKTQVKNTGVCVMLTKLEGEMNTGTVHVAEFCACASHLRFLRLVTNSRPHAPLHAQMEVVLDTEVGSRA